MKKKICNFSLLIVLLLSFWFSKYQRVLNILVKYTTKKVIITIIFLWKGQSFYVKV